MLFYDLIRVLTKDRNQRKQPYKKHKYNKGKKIIFNNRKLNNYLIDGYYFATKYKYSKKISIFILQKLFNGLK